MILRTNAYSGWNRASFTSTINEGYRSWASGVVYDSSLNPTRLQHWSNTVRYSGFWPLGGSALQWSYCWAYIDLCRSFSWTSIDLLNCSRNWSQNI